MSELELIEEAFDALIPYVRERHEDREYLDISSKSHANDLVTEVDIEVQRQLVSLIQEAFPDDVVVGEEGRYARYPGDPCARAWLIDPIDGTQNFVRSLLPEFGISIAFSRGGLPVAGGVAFPVTGDVFLAERGAGRGGMAAPFMSPTCILCLLRVSRSILEDRLRAGRRWTAHGRSCSMPGSFGAIARLFLGYARSRPATGMDTCTCRCVRGITQRVFCWRRKRAAHRPI